MSASDLFAQYATLPRPDALGANVLANARKAQRGALWTLLGSLALGVPLSFARSRRSLPWEPIDMLWGGLAIAVFAVPIALVVVVILQRYVRLFRQGRMVQGVVVQPRGTGMLVRVAVGVGPDLTFIPNYQAPPGHAFPVLIGDGTSSYALVAVAPGDLRRGSLLTEAQLSQLVVG